MAYTYEFPAHYVSVDSVIFGADVTGGRASLHVLLVERGDPKEPFFAHWELPGGFVRPDESVFNAAERSLLEETGLAGGVHLEQLYTFGDLDRDPRGRVISVGYFALIDKQRCRVSPGSDAANTRWFDVTKLPQLAFDHQKVVIMAMATLRMKIRREPLAFGLLPDRFTRAQLHALYEAILGQSIDRSNFRRSLVKMRVLRTVGKAKNGGRSVTLYGYDSARYLSLVRRGLHFDL